MSHAREQGASLAGVLMIVVVLGALAALALLGASTLTGSDDTVNAVIGTRSTPSSGGTGVSSNRGNPFGAATACAASADAARAASTVYFVSTGSHPATWSDLTAATPSNFVMPENVLINRGNPKELDGKGWKLIMAGGGSTAPTFTCS